MQEEVDLYFETAQEGMDEAMSRLKRELSKVRTGKASPSILDGLLVEYYGSPTALKQVANVGVQDARTLSIQPWEKNMFDPIERAIFAANLGLTPQNDGVTIRITIPMLTEERRKSLVKQVKSFAEDAKISVRNNRRDLMEEIKNAVKDGYPEDMGKRAETKAQDLTKAYYDKVDKLSENKETDIMTI